MSTGQENPKDSAQGDLAKDELAKRLEAVGLSAEYWLPKLREHLGVTSTQALKHLQRKDYLKLECRIQHPWEKQALQELIKTDRQGTMQQVQEQRLKMLTKRQEQAKLALQELNAMLEQGKSRHEETVKRREEELQQVMDIAPEYWVPSEKPLVEVMEKVHKELSLSEELMSQSENLPDKEVLKRASGGLALQGIYKTNQLAEMMEKREQLIDIPEEFELSGPLQGPLFETKEFSSAQAESMFTRTMEKLGFSMTVMAKGGFMGFSVETSSDFSSSSESEETHMSRSEHTYISTTKYSYIPLASCYFPKHQLRLSSAALLELKEIEQLLSHIPEPDKLNMLKSRCGSFFNRFGSHVNQGPLHLGGIFWWKAASEGFQAEQLEEIKKQTSDALSCYIGCSYSGLAWSVAAGVMTSKSDSKASFQGTDKKQMQTEIQLYVTKTGGPPEVNALTVWKSGLLASNKTWSVIDRGSQLIPVWDIILSNHRQDFKDVSQMGSSLTRVYEALTNLNASTLVGEEIVSAVDEARSFLEQVKTWTVTGDEEQLMSLLNFKENLIEKTNHNKTWIDICLSDRVLQDFLEKTVSLCKDLPVQKTKYTKFLLRCLLDPHIYSVKNFPSASSIMQWIFHAEEKQEEAINVHEFSDFIRVLEDTRNYIQAITSPGAEEKPRVKASLDVSLAFSSLRKALQNLGEIDIEVLLLSIAACVGYRAESSTFQYLLGCFEINFMLKEMQKAHKKYMTLRKQDISRAQAFVLLTGLTVIPEVEVVSPEEKNKRLTFMKHHLGHLLSGDVADALMQLNACDDWNILERNLTALVKGNYEASNSNLQNPDIVKELRNIYQRAKQTTTQPKPQAQVPPRDVQMYEGFKTQDVLNLIKRLGLEKYYPRKMGMAHFHVINKTSLHDSQPSTESELPFYFLQKLLMLDYRVRYLVCKDDSTTKDGISKALKVSGKVDESSDATSDIYEDFLNDDEGTNESFTPSQMHVHPMDIQMAIFHCSDDFMRQYLSTKLAFCQFALPLLVPNPHTSKIEFPLWALSQVQKNWQQVEKSGAETCVKNYKNKLIYQAATPVVSFSRIGHSPHSSKSKILNALLSKHRHDIFFHRDCRGSSKDCLLMKGVVEVSWYCPGGKNDDRFDNCIAFTNLHGDAREHEQQVRFLHEIASINVVLLTTSDENEIGKQIMNDFLKSPKPFVCLFTEKENPVASKSNLNIKIAMKNRNEAELIDELATTIKDLLAGSIPTGSLETCVEVARRHGFHIDEDKEECKEAKSMAQTVMALFKENNLSGMKENLLPLQGELWHKWCKKDKELTRLQDKKGSIEQHRSQIESEKRAIRHDQIRRASSPSDLMRSVLEILQSHSETTKKYFLQWLKVFMDDLSSDRLSELRQKYHALWSQMVENIHPGENDDSKSILKSDLEKVSNDINASTIGLEHILREVAQIYEALDTFPQEDQHFLELPQIAADLMASGYPIELMDGDVSYVPLKWVRAVFDKLTEKLGDKKVFVLSVLGIQSTGKSTLLNAMFGLQFSVSAGRCTRGAFMQLIKVDENLHQNLNIDYILVVDTEGLRAMELPSKSTLNHDNELATFVIGLGNMTLINIFGENPSEMQDILQIAVQAFLRMKQVKLSPSCLFVHQNVGEITAKEQNMEGQRRLQQKLDEMTVIAAQQEFCDVNRFSDVIRFDVNTHVHYFAHLWEGDPPMAPPNPSYSQNVHDLKSKILMAAKKESQGSVLRLSELKGRIGDLWKALLNENFVFSFKNTLEIATYNKLETMFNQWTWQLRSNMLELQTKLSNRIKKREIHHITRRSLEEEIKEKYDAIINDTDRYFTEDQDSEILIQWRTSIENKLRQLKESLINETERKSEELIKLKRNQSKFDEKKSEYENELFKRSKDLALRLKGKKLSEEELKENFDSLWKRWVYEVSSDAPSAEEPNISMDVENIFLEHFKQEPNVAVKIKESSWTNMFSVDISKHIVMKKTLGLLSKSLDNCDRKKIEQVTSHIMHLVERIIALKEQQRMDYNQSYIHEILNEIRREVDSACNNSKYTFNNEYRIELSLYLCKMAAERFKEMHRAFKNANDPTIYLENKRGDFFKCFQISCKGATSITTFADFLCDKLSAAIRQAVYDKTAIEIASEMRCNYSAFNGNRSKLETSILISLAEEENFEKYRQYIHSPREFLKSFIKKCVNDYCLDKKNPRLKHLLNISLDLFQTRVILAIHDSTRIVKDKNGTVSLWLDEFCVRLEDDLDLPRSDLKSIEHQEIKDIEFLKEAMSIALPPVLDNLKKEFAVVGMEALKQEPHKMLFDQLCGCWEQCPFCKALCTNTIPGHDGDHSVTFHRPQALNGTQWYGTDQFVIDICSSLVASDCFMVLSEQNQIPYRNYRKAGPAYANWSITEDNSAQSYWRWFVCHFRSILEEDYCAKFEGKGAIPLEWAEFTKTAVISELKGMQT
ncbi:interferon-induced very large GTPase 1-like [Carettochelys insculpta]|uniref:interferon-induced very large GTPase 1-like n=1 Tax=Carettochelys insculpta TaxID=44489 RepID=UPI003EBFA33B